MSVAVGVEVLQVFTDGSEEVVSICLHAYIPFGILTRILARVFLRAGLVPPE